MTLVMMAVTPRGVWQSADHRVVELPSRKTVIDESVKFVGVRCSNGACLVTYTGIGLLRELPLSDWLRGVLAGRIGPVAAMLELIRDGANETLSAVAYRHRVQHTFVIGGFEENVPWVGVITNVQPRRSAVAHELRQTFEVGAIGIDRGRDEYGWPDPWVNAWGAGAAAVSPDDWQLLRQLGQARPRPEDFQRVLADINRRAATSGHSAASAISPHCLSAYLSPEGEIHTKSFDWPHDLTKPPEVPVPVVLDGIDMTDFAGMFDTIIGQFRMKDGTALPADEVGRVRREAFEYFEDTTGRKARLRPKKPNRRR